VLSRTVRVSTCAHDRLPHGASAQEREDARILRLVIDARRPMRHGDHQRADRNDDPEARR